jgi:hypothetical protein
MYEISMIVIFTVKFCLPIKTMCSLRKVTVQSATLTVSVCKATDRERKIRTSPIM